MSFTALVKDEVSRLDISETERISELSAIVQNSEHDNKIKIVTENNTVARLIYSLFKDIFNVYPKVSVRRGYNYNKNMLYTLEVRQKISHILRSLGISSDVPENFIYADEDLLMAYLKGLFLMKASVNDPKTSRYHLEFNLDNFKYAEFVSNCLNHFNLNSKILHREHRYVVYIKEAEKIGDFLRIMGAVKAVLYFEDIRIYRDHKNMTNRLNNCEQANVDRAIETALNQVKDIKFIENNGNLDMLNEKEKIAANYRLKYPEASLLELAEIISMETETKTSKSSLYYRFKKISEIALKIKENYK